MFIQPACVVNPAQLMVYTKFGWLNLSNAKLSLKWCWQGPRSQEGDYLMLDCHHHSDSCIAMGSD